MVKPAECGRDDLSRSHRRPTEALSEAVSKNAVSVAPGHSAVTRTPVPRVSPHSASVNDSTYALFAPSRRGFEQRLQHLTDILEALISR